MYDSRLIKLPGKNESTTVVGNVIDSIQITDEFLESLFSTQTIFELVKGCSMHCWTGSGNVPVGFGNISCVGIVNFHQEHKREIYKRPLTWK